VADHRFLLHIHDMVWANLRGLGIPKVNTLAPYLVMFVFFEIEKT
jgi:hypothetical protein